MQKLLLRPTEAAEALGVGRTVIYTLLKRGQIPGVIRLGKSVRISAEALNQWVREQAEQQAN